VAGYFDGDGTIATSDVSNRPYRLGLSLIFTDQSIDQIANIRDFLHRQGIRTSNILKTSKGTANIVVVSEFNSVKKTLKAMLPFLCKKSNETLAAIQYYEGKSTGNALLAVFREEVEAGRRERRDRKVTLDIPYTITEGKRITRERKIARLRDAFGRFRAKVTSTDYVEIREEHFAEGRSLLDLMAKYPQYSKETIRRILGRDRGYVGVKGIGLVSTTDITIREPRRA